MEFLKTWCLFILWISSFDAILPPSPNLFWDDFRLCLLSWLMFFVDWWRLSYQRLLFCSLASAIRFLFKISWSYWKASFTSVFFSTSGKLLSLLSCLLDFPSYYWFCLFNFLIFVLFYSLLVKSSLALTSDGRFVLWDLSEVICL